MLREALAYPARTDEKTLLVGAILSLSVGLLARLGVFAVVALVPAVLLAGYALAVFRASATVERYRAGDDEPPAFSGVRTLAADGVRALIVAVGYLAVPAVLLAVTVGGGVSGTRPANPGTSVFVLGASTAVLVLTLGFVYLLPAGLAGVARTGRLRSAVDPARLRRSTTDARYFVGWVEALVVIGLASFLVASLASLGRPGQMIALAVGFYALVVISRLLGRSIGD